MVHLLVQYICNLFTSVGITWACEATYRRGYVSYLTDYEMSLEEGTNISVLEDIVTCPGFRDQFITCLWS
jgi:hypothetical protein